MDYQTVRQLKGLELGKAVAKALGWKVEPYTLLESMGYKCRLVSPDGHPYHLAMSEPEAWLHLPDFESSIAYAFPLAEKFGYAVMPHNDRWYALPFDEFPTVRDAHEVRLDDDFSGDSPAEAICRCYLLKEVS